MNKLDYEELLPEGHQLILDARSGLGVEVKPMVSVPRGYVRHLTTGTIYKLETWMEKLRRGLVALEDGEIVEESDAGDGDRTAKD